MSLCVPEKSATKSKDAFDANAIKKTCIDQI